MGCSINGGGPSVIGPLSHHKLAMQTRRENEGTAGIKKHCQAPRIPWAAKQRRALRLEWLWGLAASVKGICKFNPKIVLQVA